MAQSLALAVTAMVAGTMAFFAGVVAPTVFRVLDPLPAGRYLAALFPAYYAATGGAALLAAAGWLAAQAPFMAALMAVVAGGFAVARWVLVPRIEAVRDAAKAGDADAQRTFARLHRASVALNLVQFALVLAVLAQRIANA